METPQIFEQFLNLDFPYTETMLAAAAAFLLGTVWYHPKILGEKWMLVRGRTGSDVRPGVFAFIYTFILWFLASGFYSFLVILLHVDNAAGFLCLSSLVWVAFTMPPTVMGAFYTGYPFEAVAVDMGYQLAGYYLFAGAHILMGMLVL